MAKVRTYSELKRLSGFEERFEYLKLGGGVGLVTFGFDRWINQRFYKSREWRTLREYVIHRDGGCDLGIPGYELLAGLLIHHMNPMTLRDIQHEGESILDPEFLITASKQTHNAIHYGAADGLPRGPVERKAGDTSLW
jgi:hypothetical protein